MPKSVSHIMLVAGEASGDLLGARLMTALKIETGGRIRFTGVGGDNMTGQGLQSLFPMEELSVMGFAEVIPRLPNLLRRIRETAAAASETMPDALVTIDSPGFCLRVARRLKGKGIPLIHYVAPQVWAWRPGRARKIARTLDHLLALLPFEPPYFEKEGLPCDFVGHSVVENCIDKTEQDAFGRSFRVDHGLSLENPLLLVLHGSRRSEVDRLLPVFGETVEQLGQQLSNLQVVVPTLAPVEMVVRQGVDNWRNALARRPLVIVEKYAKEGAFAAADAALAASGTVSLELAVVRVPTVIAYKLHPISAWIGRRLITVPWISLTNIILNRSLVPELIQNKCRAKNLVPEVIRLLTDQSARKGQIAGAEQVLKKLGLGNSTLPSQQAAQAILTVIDRRVLSE